jgi:hypothetical protein
MKDQISILDATLEDKIGAVNVEVSDLEAQNGQELKEIRLQLEFLNNSIEIQRNSMASRFYSPVHPLCIATGNGHDVQRGVAGKTVGWYWKCHEPNYSMSSII